MEPSSSLPSSDVIAHRLAEVQLKMDHHSDMLNQLRGEKAMLEALAGVDQETFERERERHPTTTRVSSQQEADESLQRELQNSLHPVALKAWNAALASHARNGGGGSQQQALPLDPNVLGEVFQSLHLLPLSDGERTRVASVLSPDEGGEGGEGGVVTLQHFADLWLRDDVEDDLVTGIRQRFWLHVYLVENDGHHVQSTPSPSTSTKETADVGRPPLSQQQSTGSRNEAAEASQDSPTDPLNQTQSPASPSSPKTADEQQEKETAAPNATVVEDEEDGAPSSVHRTNRTSRSASVQSNQGNVSVGAQSRRVQETSTELQSMLHSQRAATVLEDIRNIGESIPVLTKQLWDEAKRLQPHGGDSPNTSTDHHGATVSTDALLAQQLNVQSSMDEIKSRVRAVKAQAESFDNDCIVFLSALADCTPSPSPERDGRNNTDDDGVFSSGLGTNKEAVEADRTEVASEMKLLEKELYEMQCSVYEILWLNGK